MVLAGDNISKSIKTAAPILHHFHVSAPYLEQVEDRPDIPYREAAKALEEIGYKGFVSIEMRPGNPGENSARTKIAVDFAQKVFGKSS
jgi:sugar phosphate isomerase/epimerase